MDAAFAVEKFFLFYSSHRISKYLREPFRGGSFPDKIPLSGEIFEVPRPQDGASRKGNVILIVLLNPTYKRGLWSTCRPMGGLETCRR
jgi:hypothetical protein